MSDSSTLRLILVSGAPGSGKTSAVKFALEQLAGSGFRARAVLSEATERIGEGYALGFDAVFYEVGATTTLTTSAASTLGPSETIMRMPFARRPPPEEGPGDVKARMKPFSFSSEAFSRSRVFLCEEAGRLDLIAVDEVGPLELKDNGGYALLLEDWKSGKSARTLLATVRPSLAGELARRLAVAEVRTVTLDGSTIGEAARRIVDLLKI